MTARLEYAKIVQTIPANGISDTLYFSGRQLYVSKATADFLIRVDENSYNDCELGFKYTVPENEKGFEKFQFKNTSGTPIDIEIFVSDGTIEIDKVVLSGTVTTKESEPSATNGKISVTTSAVNVLPAASRKGVQVQNTSVIETLYIGSSAADADSVNGYEIAPQGEGFYPSNDDIYMSASAALTAKYIQVTN